MNRLKLLLIGSVAINVALITLLAFTRASSPRPPPHSTSETASAPTAAPVAAEVRRDYARLLESLLSRGFPKSEAVRIVHDAALNDWISAFQQIQNEHPYWQPPLSPLEKLARQREIVQERRARETALAEILGEPRSLDPLDETAIHLPPETSPAKIHAVAWIEEDYRMLLADLEARSGLAENRETVAMLERERREDLAAILSPEELAHYEIRASATARALRDELRYFEPAESEFRAIFDARLQTDPESAQSGLRESLGEDRFQAYLRATDENFQRLVDLAERFQLPPQNVLEVHRFTRQLEDQQREILNDATLSEDEKIVALDLLLAEGREIISQQLGTPAYEAYLENGGWWLQSATLSLADPEN